jgi:hypothetical protein
MQIVIGESFLKFLAGYKFVGRHEPYRIPQETLDEFVDDMKQSLCLVTCENEQVLDAQQDLQDWFEREYGRHTLRKLFLFTMDYSNVSLTAGYTEDDIINALTLTNVFLYAFRDQQRIFRPKGLQLRLVLADEKDEKPGVFIDKKVM